METTMYNGIIPLKKKAPNVKRQVAATSTAMAALLSDGQVPCLAGGA